MALRGEDKDRANISRFCSGTLHATRVYGAHGYNHQLDGRSDRVGGREHVLRRASPRRPFVPDELLRLARTDIATAAAGGPLFCCRMSGAVMQHHQHIASAAAALLVWALPANAEPPGLESDIASVYSEAPGLPAR